MSKRYLFDRLCFVFVFFMLMNIDEVDSRTDECNEIDLNDLIHLYDCLLCFVVEGKGRTV